MRQFLCVSALLISLGSTTANESSSEKLDTSILSGDWQAIVRILDSNPAKFADPVARWRLRGRLAGPGCADGYHEAGD